MVRGMTGDDSRRKQTTLVTGASGGLGEALARCAAAEGHDLVLAGRRMDRLRALAEELAPRHGIHVLSVPCDLSLPDAADALFHEVLAHGCRVDNLVNNAGFGQGGDVADISPQRQADLLTVNALTPLQLTRLFLPSMLTRGGGGVLNVASLAALTPGPGMAAYYASKACLLSYTEALHFETRGTGVRVSALCPGPAATGFAREARMENARLFRRAMTAEETAREGWRGFLRGRRVIIPGWRNRFLALAIRALPHALTARAAKLLHAPADA